jgi:hypothetical protein
MTPLRHHYNMPNTGERGEITGRVNGKEAERRTQELSSSRRNQREN